MNIDDYSVRLETANAVYRLVEAAGGSFTDRPGPSGRPVRTPAPADGIRAAAAVGHRARRLVAEYARCAREDGQSWQQIADALGCKGDPDRGVTPAGEAFRQLAADYGSSLSFPFTCGACRRLVVDYGPGMPERGHAGSCERFAATLAAREEQWRDE